MTLDTQAFNNLAITGMSVAWGGCDDLDAFERLIYTGSVRLDQAERASEKTPIDNWPALLEDVTAGALRDADLDHSAARILLLHAGAQLSRAVMAQAGSVKDISAEANPLAAAVRAAQQALASGLVDAVVYAACSGPISVPENTPMAQGAKALGFDRSVHGWRLGQGAGAVVFQRHDEALSAGNRVYATIRALAAVKGAQPVILSGMPQPLALDLVRGCCQAAVQAAGITPPQVGYVEAFASGLDALDGVEIAGLVQAYRQPVQDLSTALGSAQSHLGYLGPASGLAGLVQAALCLYHRMVPGSPGWATPKLPALWRGAPFYVPVESRAWFTPPHLSARTAGVSLPGLGGSYAHLVLAEAVEQPDRPNQALAQGGFYLIPLSGTRLEDLLDRLELLNQALAGEPDLPSLAAEYYLSAAGRQEDRLGLAIVGRSAAELAREIEMALRALPAAYEKGGEWQTPAGSYFTSQPVGQSGSVALVYPGAFNSYPGVGKDLLRLFPGLYEHVERITADLSSVFRERQLFPRSLAALSKEELSALEASLLADPISMLISGAALAILYTHILQDGFGIQPAAAFGYSLGENSMMFATGVWAQGDQAAARLEDSQAFRVRLAGPQLAVREHWGLDAAAQPQAPLWSNYLVMAAPEKVQAAVAREPHVYLTHINTPRQVVIGGDPQACQRVLAELKSSSLQAPFDYALHCEVMRSEYQALAELHDWPVEGKPNLKMYSAADYGPMQVEEREIAEKIAHMLTTPLDFPRLVQTVYAGGARVFIEVGAGSNCARWIDETLKSSPHLSLSLNRRGTDDYTTLVRTMARLFCHRVPVNMERFYHMTKVRQSV